jgi:hypothetical protein
VEFELGEPSQIKIELFDALARRVKSFVVEEKMGAGQHRIGISDLDISPGVYWLRTSIGKLDFFTKLIKI